MSQQEMKLQFSQMLDLVVEDELIGVMKNSPDTEAFVMQRIAEISSDFLTVALQKNKANSQSQIDKAQEEQEMGRLKAKVELLEAEL